MRRAEPTAVYYVAAQEVLNELGLLDRCVLSNASAQQDMYRWCLRCELGKATFTVAGDEDGTEPAAREVIKHKIRAAVFEHINEFGI